MGLLTVVPLALWRWGPTPSTRGVFFVNVGFLGVTLGLWSWARDSLGRTVINRALTRGVVAIPALALLLAASADALGVAAPSVISLLLLLAAAVCVALGAAVEPALLTGAVVYALGFLVASLTGASGALVLGVCNGALLALVLARWGPSAAASWRQLRAEKRAKVRK